MAITNAQQAKQLLAQGGRIGFQGGGKDSSTISSGDFKARDYTPSEKRNQQRTADLNQRIRESERGQQQTANTQAAINLAQGINVPKEKKKLNFNIPDFKTAAKKGINFFRKSYYNRFPNNPEMEFRYIDQMSEDEYDDLPQSLKDAFEKTKTSPAIKSEKTYKDFDKLSFEDFDVLANDPKFKQYAYDRGSPGLFVSGDMSKVGDKFVKKDPITGETLRDPKTGQILYGYSPVREGGGRDDFILPQNMMAEAPSIMDQEPIVEEEPFEISRRFRAEGGIMNSDVVGGEMDFESARQMYGLGKLVKKVTRSVKKIAKSPIGKAALLYAGGAGLSALGAGSAGTGFGMKMFGPKAFASNLGMSLGKLGLGSKFIGPSQPKSLVDMLGGKIGVGILGASAIAGMLTPQQEEEAQNIADETGIDIAEIRANPNKYLARRFRAEGGSMDEPVAKKTMPLLDMGGKEMDLRAEGGFVPLGRMEKADDVPARLSKNEFVFTADAVRNAGEGDVDKGAEVMYNMMKNLESGGDVSEESQGLEGARKMFQTSQRLEEVI